ncbi:MAG: carboxymuconolactone decarboxylase family protein [Pseudomonadota bacterium]
MPRITVPPREELQADQQAVYDAIVQGPRGGIYGPTVAWLSHPVVAQPAQALGAALRFEGLLPGALRELAILVTARHWKAPYEWAHHAPLALKEGLAPEIVEALKLDRVPVFTSDQEFLVYRVARRLLSAKTLDAALYEEAKTSFTEKGLVELVALVGYYSLVAMTLTAFEILPEEH